MKRFLDILPLLCLLALAVLAGLAARPSRADEAQCIGLPDALASLAAGYGEAPRVTGLTSTGVLLIVTAGEAGGWSMLLVTPDGRACMVASGEAFELIEPPKPGIDG